MGAQYSYLPIHHHTEIRILEIQPPDPKKPHELRGELIVVSLAEQPFYEALSYCWGDPVFSEQIFLGNHGKHMLITPNLAAGLRRLRHPDRTRRLWADAICINQKDDVEKSAQVSLMGKIYLNTSQVLVWLGEGDENTHRAMELVEKLALEAEKYGCSTASPLGNMELVDCQDERIGEALLALGTSTDIGKLLYLFNQPWFKRLWIVQEVYLARQLSFNLAGESVEMENFETAVAIVAKASLEVSRSVGGDMFDIGRVVSLTHGRRTYQPALQPKTILQLVEDHSSRAHSHSHDQIYALLGLEREKDDISLEVDYRLSIEDLFLQFAWKHLEIGNLWILSQGVESYKEGYAAEIPSWVPDWRCSRVPRLWQKGDFGASNVPKPFLAVTKDDMTILGMQGILIGTLTKVVGFDVGSNQPTDVTRREFHYKIMSDQLSGIERMLRDSGGTDNPYGTKESLSIAFASTLIFGGRPSILRMILGEGNLEECLNRWIDFQDYTSHTSCTLSLEVQERLKRFGGPESRAVAYFQALCYAQTAQKFLITESGFIGIGTAYSHPGDVVVVFDGAETPSILRRVPNPLWHPSASHRDRDEYKFSWKMVGNCYLHGFMDGEASDPKFGGKKQEFFLV